MLFAAEAKPVDHVQDEAGWTFWHNINGSHFELHLPEINLGFYKLQITKFMVLELIAAGLILLVYIPLARRIRNGDLPRGRTWNFFEFLLTFIRDDVARPNLDGHGTHHDAHAGGHAEHAVSHGHEHHHNEHAPAGPQHDGDRFLPFLWTLFLFVLVCNLLGMIPMMGSPTASIWVTGGLALISFVVMHGVAIAKYGPVKYMVNLWPKMGPALVPISAMIFVIELFGTVIKSFVLAVRLFANMFAGHLVLATILSFIMVVGNAMGTGMLWGGVTVASVAGVVALSLLELFVGFLQAYIFTFLTALFMGMSLHGEH
jgi:F-type H+-transporting ATPase subunit a